MRLETGRLSNDRRCLEDNYRPHSRVRVQEDNISRLSKKMDSSREPGFVFSSRRPWMFTKWPPKPHQCVLPHRQEKIPRKGHEDERASHIFQPLDSDHDYGIGIGIQVRNKSPIRTTSVACRHQFTRSLFVNVEALLVLRRSRPKLQVTVFSIV